MGVREKKGSVSPCDSYLSVGRNIFHISTVSGKRQLAEVDVHLILRMPSKMRKTWNKLGRKN